MRIFDRNRYLTENPEEMIAVCGGDTDQAETIRLMLLRSYKRERYQNYKPWRNHLVFIDGEPIRLKYKPSEERYVGIQQTEE